jgi:hypothetical protein
LEIFEEAGMQSKADEVLSVLEKIAHTSGKVKQVQKLPALQSLMDAGITQRDIMEFTKGSPMAKAKLNIVMRSLGFTDHDIAKFMGAGNVMSEEDAKELIDPNRAFSKMWKWIQDPNAPMDEEEVKPGETLEFTSVAAKKKVRKPDKVKDWHTKNLSPEKMVANLKGHGTMFNMSDDGADCNKPVDEKEEYQQWLKQLGDSDKLSKNDIDPNWDSLLDIDSSDDLLDAEVKDDTLEVFDKEIPLTDFVDEKD